MLLSGIVGSTAYGLARGGSDVDRLGVFAAPTVVVSGLDWSASDESSVQTKPDVTRHEVGKYLRLALRGNPSILELLWLPGELVETAHPFYGTRLIGLRTALLSEPAVRSAYAGYARQQAHRLANRGDPPVGSEEHRRAAKHARHLTRLLRQGRGLLATGVLTVPVPDPEFYWRFDTLTLRQMLAVYEDEDARFAAAGSVLPAEPDRASVQKYLATVRAAFLWGEEGVA
jgi:predicted nucleotidyltransferase